MKRLSSCFFPGEKSSEGNFTDFVVDVTDFKEQAIDDQITVGELYEQTKLPVLCFYLTTKKKIIPSDTQSDTQFHFSSKTIAQRVENMQDSWSPTHTSQSALFSENVEPDLIYVGSSAVIATGSDDVFCLTP